MGSADKLFEQIFNEHLNNLHTAMPCEVVVYYDDLEKADLQPLFKRKKGGATKGYPMISKAPLLEHVPKPLEPGDTVFVVFAERALDHVGTRRHDLTDAVIIGKLP